LAVLSWSYYTRSDYYRLERKLPGGHLGPLRNCAFPRRTAKFRLDVYLPRSTRTKLEKFAKREGMSASVAVQIIISQCLTKDGKQKPWDFL